jgi:hypothetical protein
MSTEYARTDGFVYRLVAGEHLLLALKRDRTAPMFMLTATGAFVWERLASWASLDALVEAVVERFEVDVATAAADVTAFLQQLEQLGAATTRTATA